MQLQFYAKPSTLGPIAHLTFYQFAAQHFFPFSFFVGFSNTFLHFFAALQQTILLRVNNCNNLGLIDARCNAEVSPLAEQSWQEEEEQQEQKAGVGFCTSFDHVYAKVWREVGGRVTFFGPAASA